MTDAVTGVNQADYMKLFMQELTYQDPLKPIDNREFMAQMAQFSALQEAHATNESLNQLVNLTAGNRGLMLIGKNVTMNGSSDIGKVTGITFTEDANHRLKININGSSVTTTLDNITAVL